MGTILRGLCKDCGLQSELYVGGGLCDCRPEAAVAASGGDAALAAALEKGASFRIERRAAACPRCKKLFAAARVTYGSGAEEKHTASFCWDCKAPIPWPQADRERIRCPVCGHDILLTQAGHWD